MLVGIDKNPGERLKKNYLKSKDKITKYPIESKTECTAND